MAEYIERDALHNEITAVQKTLESDNDDVWYRNKKYFKGLARAHQIIRAAPAADVVPVVRCKDCVSGHKQLYGNLFRCNVMGCGGLKPDDFCSYGELRDGE